MVQYKDRVRESTSTTGTGDVTLAGAPTGFRSFNAAYGTSVQFDYAIVSSTGAQWEIGEGHLSGATTLVRDTVHASTNADALVNFSAGAKDVRSVLSGASIQAGIGNQTTFIRTLLDDANASTARATLELTYASAAEQETGTATDRVVAPGTQHRHPSAAKAWAYIGGGGTPVLTASYNMTSIVDTAVGRVTCNIATDFSSGAFPAIATPLGTATTTYWLDFVTSLAAGSFEITCYAAASGAAPVLADPGAQMFAAFGDQ